MECIREIQLLGVLEIEFRETRHKHKDWEVAISEQDDLGRNSKNRIKRKNTMNSEFTGGTD